MRSAFARTLSLLVIAGACAPLGGTHLKPLSDPSLHFDICVFNDSDDPAPKRVIRRAIRETTLSYFEEMNIRLTTLPGIHPFSFDGTLTISEDRINLHSFDTPRNTCVVEPDLFLLITDRRMPGKAGYAFRAEKGSFIILFNAHFRSAKKDEGGHSALTTTLMHEVAHHFGVGHTKDTRSFMYHDSNDSYGEWTPAVKALMRKQLSSP